MWQQSVAWRSNPMSIKWEVETPSTALVVDIWLLCPDGTPPNLEDPAHFFHIPNGCGSLRDPSPQQQICSYIRHHPAAFFRTWNLRENLYRFISFSVGLGLNLRLFSHSASSNCYLELDLRKILKILHLQRRLGNQPDMEIMKGIIKKKDFWVASLCSL